jgi:hypothetical protein
MKEEEEEDAHAQQTIRYKLDLTDFDVAKPGSRRVGSNTIKYKNWILPLSTKMKEI